MEKSITIDSMFDGRSHHGAFRQHLKHRWKWWLVARSAVCISSFAIGIYMYLQFSGKGDKRVEFVSIAFILIGAIGLIRPMVWQMWHERRLRKHPAYESKIRYVFSNEGMIMTGDAGAANVPWSEFYELVETPIGLLIYQNKKSYIWIPEADLASGETKKIIGFWQKSTQG